jgi:probable addiction module antidote protein
VRPFDVAEHLGSPEAIAAYLNEAFETRDMAFMLAAIRDVARARSMTAVAKETVFAREALYRAQPRQREDRQPHRVCHCTYSFGGRLHCSVCGASSLWTGGA